jgi:hypothetical protein
MFQRPEKKDFRTLFLNSLARVDSYTPAGINLGKTDACCVDMKRINNVIKRIVRGLFYKEKNRRLPDNYQVWSYHIDDVINEYSRLLGTFMMKDIITSILQGKSLTIGNGVFRYWFKFMIDEENSSAFVLSFYDRVNFLVLTTPGRITE